MLRLMTIYHFINLPKSEDAGKCHFILVAELLSILQRQPPHGLSVYLNLEVSANNPIVHRFFLIES